MMLTRALLALLLAATSPIAAQNLLPNSDFENGIAPWGSHQEKGARRSQGVEAVEGAQGKQAARIDILAADGSNHVQFTCPFESSKLTVGEVYKLTFLAKADPAREFTVHLIGAERPWGNVGLRETVRASTEWRSYEYLFRARQPNQERVKVDFFLGDVEGAVWFDDVQLAWMDMSEQPEPDGPKLKGTGWELAFSDTGGIARLTQGPAKMAVVGGLRTPPAYSLDVWRAGASTTVTSNEAKRITRSGDDGRVEFSFEHEDFTVATSADASDPARVSFSISVQNRGDAAITAVRYPILYCPPKLGDDSADDAILYPRCDGGLIENPMRVMGGSSLDDLYPGPLSCQVMAYYDAAAGLYLGCHDASGRPKRFGCGMGVDLELSITHEMARTAGESFELTGPTLAVFTGDWYDAAEIYRQWARTTPWCEKTLLERTDTPEWVKGGGMVTMYNPRVRNAEGKYRFSPEGLRSFLQGLKDDYGLAPIPNNRGWERWGEWTGQEYFPPYPNEERFAEDAKIIREVGGQSMLMFSGYRWTIEKPQADGSVYDSSDRFDKEVKQFATFGPDGITPNVSTSSRQDDWHGTKYARLCPATQFAKDIIVDTARRCVQAGYSIIHFDQEVSGPASTSLCFSNKHGHAPGYGPWMHEAMADLYERIRDACEPLDDAFTLSMEEPNELYLPWLNICQSRPNGLTNEFPIRHPMTRVVPLFSYLYHDYLVGWTAFYPWRSPGYQTYSLARGFSAGMMPGLHPESIQRWPVDRQQEFNTMLRNCNAAYAGAAREYLIFGKMLKPLALDVPRRELDMGEKFGKTTVPAVSNSVWQLPDGRRAVVLINPEREVHEVRLPGLARTVTVPALDVLVVKLGERD